MAAWILVAALVVAGTAGVLGGILSRSLLVDVAALWPLPVLAILIGVVARLARRSRRAGAILPLAFFSALVLAAALHLGGWDRLPSGAIALTGPPPSELSQPTEMIVQVSGDLVVGPGPEETAYRIEPIPRGGRVGVPRATETSVDGAVSVQVEASPEAPAWYTFAGWTVELSPAVTWRLVLNGNVEADLTALVLSSAAIAGSGGIRLGPPPSGGASVIIAGDFRVEVPQGAPVTVSGQAHVPSGWEQAGRGQVSERYRSPSTEEGGWMISVQGDAVPTIVEVP